MTFINNGDAETGNMNGWTYNNVSVVAGGVSGSHYFKLSPSAWMSQSVTSFPTHLVYANFDISFDFLLPAGPVENIDVKFVVQTECNYIGSIRDLSRICLQDIIWPVSSGSWLRVQHLVPVRENETLSSLVLSVRTFDTDTDVGIDNIYLERKLLPVAADVENAIGYLISYGLDADKPPLGVE